MYCSIPWFIAQYCKYNGNVCRNYCVCTAATSGDTSSTGTVSEAQPTSGDALSTNTVVTPSLTQPLLADKLMWSPSTPVHGIVDNTVTQASVGEFGFVLF